MIKVLRIYSKGFLENVTIEKLTPWPFREKFTKQYGGKVFYIFLSRVGERKEIKNKEVIAEIKKEIELFKK
ncbi:MAG: hypothetical protein ABSB22_06015 [Thermodesulfobacteriota bacterium]|jgi:hypothetical protein